MKRRIWSKGLGWICAALTALLLGQVLSGILSGYGDTAVAAVHREEPVYVTGTVLRQEELITLPETGDWTPVRASGERVGAGQTLFHVKQSPEASEAARQVRMLRQGLTQRSAPLMVRRQRLREAVRALNAGQMETRQTQAEVLGGLCRAEWQEGTLQNALSAAEADLKAAAETGGESLTAPGSGIFSSAWDGLEQYTGARIAGRLITGDTWYYQTTLPMAVEEGDTVTLELYSGIFTLETFRVERARETENGWECLLSCRTRISEVSQLRTLTAAFPQTESGLEIPARAVYTVEAETGVWCLVGDSPRWKPVTVLETLEDTVVVTLDRSTTENLWPGDVVLLDVGE